MKLNLKTVLIGGAVALLLVVGISVFTGSSGPARALPNHFELSERILFKWKTSLDVKGDGHNLGNVSERVISLTRSFVLETTPVPRRLQQASPWFPGAHKSMSSMARATASAPSKKRC